MKLKYFSTAALGVFSIAILYSSRLQAQVVQPGTQTNGSQSNNIITAVPFLLITPDARTGSMGEAAVAVQPDVNAMGNNPSKLAFLEMPYGFSASYSPWLKNLVPDINLAYISGFYKLNDQSAIGGSLRYFSLGQIQLTDINKNDLGIYSPSEFSFDATYSKRFGNEFSLGTTGRFIYSNLTSGQFSAGQQTKAGKAFAVDVSAYYRKQTVMFNKDAIISAGANFSNIGTKLGYVDGVQKQFLPTNMKIGGASTFIIDDYNQFTFALDFNKLMVPTQPIRDSNGDIISGRDPNRSIPAGIFGSFSDAPGGFSEELKEVSIAVGAEYWYNQQFAMRAGYFYEAPEKGDRRYLTLGAGLKYNIFNIDFAYLLADPQKSPLANTLRFSLIFNFGDNK
ncbi:type IX secretion system outer membrane channel protein PorV [Pedobacter polaris]|uniref:Type IX secretion system outer membrane channel protein PorV n=1 Tax=Pedobacter polaris TaxID=2571273 RepID=A0A4U1CX89_9SPHI|nr:type IX secretion system outer membrane channel protein PorV [Pedobacter polaris]TKC13005.1 type IX secretion system outer membrane channel protein PorV [Pedobacter polaris]